MHACVGGEYVRMPVTHHHTHTQYTQYTQSRQCSSQVARDLRTDCALRA